ncbi:MAG: 30S ribosomal protein S27ae [Candidatus Micrarchaeia archaeon]
MAEKSEKKKEKKEIEYKYKKGRYCPKCGPGVKLAEHSDRFSCGKCGYFEKK